MCGGGSWSPLRSAYVLDLDGNRGVSHLLAGLHGVQPPPKAPCEEHCWIR